MSYRDELINEGIAGGGIAGALLTLAVSGLGLLVKGIFDSNAKQNQNSAKQNQINHLQSKNNELSSKYGGAGTVIYNKEIKINNQKIKDLQK